MAYVITQNCCNDSSCVAVCPVQCIRPRPGDPDFTATDQLYIDPSACIDCGACAAECPVEAIVHDAELPPHLEEFRRINADHFADHPLTEVAPPPITRRRLPRERPRLRVAVVGSGPAALYAASGLSEIRGVEVTVIEKLAVPYGLARFGVAPDHKRTRRIMERFAPILQRPNVTSRFGVEVGRDVSIEELRRHHHAVIWAVGAFTDRALGIPGEELAGSVSARDFVAWYNDHPDFADRRFDLSGRRAVIIGNGNVALDIARLLAQPVAALEHTSIARHALEALRQSAVEEVMVVARRGPASAAHGTGELLAMSHLSDVDLLAHPEEITVAEPQLDTIEHASRDLRRRLAVVREAATRVPSARRRITLRYRLTPAELTGDTAVTGILLHRPDGTAERIDTTLVIRATGFRGRATAGLPFDSTTGTIPHRAGRILAASGEPLHGLYCTGWIKRGPTGNIGANRVDAEETITSLLNDFTEGLLPDPVTPAGPGPLTRLDRTDE
ncbi:FAD-dependent oxidoreductase [Streptomyces sp. UH6]|uniref:FAD-dependent oxidoreductase n=1 Tax=Streptomyces sp. UH6 TaxID=2748379 RepID=UPI0015D486CB|nr:FAD-dependent oxidoreductase [Streptomyces sp. UH6]NYV72784.1 FAD-dependent oxidoreductase [Streptomyces sp. UH6]